jgi:hypothetical protein
MLPRFSAQPAAKFLLSAFALRLYYMRYYKSANAAKLTPLAGARFGANWIT